MKPGLAHWIGGTSLALAGVAVVRLLAPAIGSQRLWVTLAGYTLAFGGLYLITTGIRRRSRP